MGKIIAVPSENPGGLDAAVGAHFGHCDQYTLVKIENGEIEEVNVIPNVVHEQGGCMAPVQLLANSGVNQMIAGGMGMRPLMGFQQMGIDVYHGNLVQSVGEAVQALLDGRLQMFAREITCKGCGNH